MGKREAAVPAEQVPHLGFELLERHGVVVPLEAVLVVLLAERGAVVKPLVAPEGLPCVTVGAQVVEVVVPLEKAVVPDDPVGPIRHVGAEDVGGDCTVVLRGDGVSHVVEQGGHHHLVVLAVAQRPGGTLEAVLGPVHLVAEQWPSHGLQGAQDVVCQVVGLVVDQLPSNSLGRGGQLISKVQYRPTTGGRGCLQCSACNAFAHPLIAVMRRFIPGTK